MVMCRVIRTKNSELYKKLNMLTFSPEIVIKGVKDNQMTKIVNNINKHNKIVEVEKIGEYFIIKKRLPVNFTIYLNDNKWKQIYI